MTETLGAQVNGQNRYLLQKLDAEVAAVQELEAQLRASNAENVSSFRCTPQMTAINRPPSGAS